MSSSFLPPDPCHVPVPNQPAWDLALLYPMQGHWSHEDYLTLTDGTNRLIEYTNGQIEVLPVPTIEHQLILTYLFRMLDGFVVQRQLGVVLTAGTRVYIEPDRYREPDLVFNFTASHARSNRRYYDGADLVMEVVSDDPESRVRDIEDKRAEYALAGIREYWIVDPQEQQITVLQLASARYEWHGIFKAGDNATSDLLAGFSLDVTQVFAAAEGAYDERKRR